VKLTALISAYYAEKYLDGRLKNLQQFKDVEPIVVCRAFSKEYDIANGYGVKIITTGDVPTIGKAWNFAIIEAQGDYLTTANTDDKLIPGKLEKMIEVLDQHPEIGLVFSQVDMTDGKNTIPWERFRHPTGEVKDITNLLQSRCFIGAMPIWRASIHDRVGLFREDFIVANDYDMWLRMARAGVRFYYVDESCGIYYKRVDSLEHRNRSACREETAEVRK
jgi:GT2 family glycosyltransferase